MPGEGAKAQPSPTNIGGITAQTVSLSGSTATNYKAKYNYKCWERGRKTLPSPVNTKRAQPSWHRGKMYLSREWERTHCRHQ